MDEARTARVTLWVGRLILINAVGVLLLSTIFTAPRFLAALQFDPAAFTERPWAAVTYMFAHGGLGHLAINTLLLFVFGPPVERKLGSRAFLAYYLYCGVGAALFALGLSGILSIGPFVGASGAIFGVMLAFVICWPDAELTAFPAPVRITARTLFGALVAIDVVASLVAGTVGASSGIAHIAHVGGVIAGYLFFRIQALAARTPPPRPAGIVRRPVVTPMRVQETVTELHAAPPASDHRPAEFSDEAVDRVLDKISESGIESLTSQERQLLADAAERKRKEQHPS
jgi:membrane associated rhomboid family serine protease